MADWTGAQFDLTGELGGAARRLDAALLDPAYPAMEHWARAGVRGGLGPYAQVVETVPAGASAAAIQAALDRVGAAMVAADAHTDAHADDHADARAGTRADDDAASGRTNPAATEAPNTASGAVLLAKGTYVIDTPLRVPSRTVLRGDFLDNTKLVVKLRGLFLGYKAGGDNIRMVAENDPAPIPGVIQFTTAILLVDAEGAGVEHLTLVYDPGLPRPMGLRYLEPDFDKNPAPYGSEDTFVIAIGMERCTDCWVQACRVVDSGTHPISLRRCRHVTLRHSEILGAYHKHGGQAYLNCSLSESCLFAGLRVEGIRHLSIQNAEDGYPCRYNVVTGCDLAVDINYHNGDSGHNLVEGNRILIPGTHWWGPVARGVARMHQPPGPGNLCFRNDAARYQFGTLARSAPFEDAAAVYQVGESYDLPTVRPVGPAPRGGTLYPMVAP